MKNIKILLITTIIPICSLLASILFERSFEVTWQNDLISQIGEEARTLPIFNLEYSCKNSNIAHEIEEFCEFPIYSYYFRNLSICSILLALFLILYVQLTSLYSIRNRDFLIKSFKLGTYLCILGISILVLFYGIAIVTLLYFLESYLFGVIHIYILALIGLGALAASINLIKSSFNLIKPAEVYVNAIYTSQETDSIFNNLLNEVAEKVKSLKPKNIFIGIDPMFFVTESFVKINDGNVYDSNSIYLSSPILRFLEIQEFKGILAHELAHFSGEDTKYSKNFFPLYRGMLNSFQNSINEVGGGLQSISMFPLISLMNFFFESYAGSEAIISRNRELRADKIASEIVGNEVFGCALVKVYAYEELWNEMYQKLIEDVKSGTEVKNVEDYFVNFIEQSEKNSDMLTNISKYKLSHPTDSHPSLFERLDNLNLNLETIISKINLKNETNVLTFQVPIEELTEKEIRSIKYYYT
ncbi:hypothetical protein EHQ94_10840 [Leptospira meyeri]|uniref:M48 family metallopeptidase n=1 Tax=Leptospira meyeri TaxID=29508 RepID=UPI0010824C7E|nr:M48 family metallopeptidase [Leptospira meyeri]TGM58952.1 hypothetical protein EHQ93_19660 [Leptospira meyeri]TGM66500.1 hypothetical protein EHQ94_10840 [Leptospira meyeri]